MIGCINFAKDFVVCGTATDKLFGVAESLWEPDLVRLFSASRTPSLPRFRSPLPVLTAVRNDSYID